MDAEEEPLSTEDDSDLDLNFDSEEENENCLQNTLEEKKILQYKQEEISKINQQIELLKNLHLDEISLKLLPCNNDKINSIINHPVPRDEPKSQILPEGIAQSTDFSENIKNHSQDACSSSSKLCFDDVPVRKMPCKSFQEHLENILKKDDTLDPQQQVEPKHPAKRVFLKKGQGLQRFEKKKKQVSEMTVEGKEKPITSEKALSDSSKSSSNGTRPTVTQKKSSPNLSGGQRMKVQSTIGLPQKKLVMKKPVSNQNTKPTFPNHNKRISELEDENHPPKSSQSEMSSEAKIADVKKNHPPKSNKTDGTQCDTGAREQNFGPDETQPLNEFEILEGYAMDDASFLSSVSTVDKVLQLHHGMPVQDKSDCKAIPKLPPSSSASCTTQVEKNSDAPSLVTVDKVASLPSVMPQSVKNNPSNDLVILNIKRKISIGSENLSGRNASSAEDRFEEEKTTTGADNRFVPQRGEYIPGLYAGNDDTFSTDAGWAAKHPEGDFEDDASWNDVTLMEDRSIDGDLKEESKTNLVEKAIVSQPNKGQSTMPHYNKASASGSNTNDSVVVSHQSIRVDNRPASTGDVFQSRPLREKALELDAEIERYRRENAALAQLRKEQASDLSSLKKEMEEFKKHRLAEVEEFERFKNLEIQKLKKDRRLFDMLKKSHDDYFFTREDRKVQDALKADMEKLREETKLKEQRWKANSERMKDRIEQLEKENMDLKGKLIFKEQELLKMKSQNRDPHPASKKKSRERYSFEEGFVNRATSMPNPPCLVQNGAESETVLDKTSLRHDRIHANSGEVLVKGEVVRHQSMPDGSVKVAYAKVSNRILNPDGSETIEFSDGDTQQNFSDGTKLYVFTEHNIRHYFYPDGLQIFYFPCGQVEKIFANGTKEIEFPNGNLKYVYADGSEETILLDGTVIKSQRDGTITKELINGIKEIYYNDVRRIEYPEGAVKTIHKDGSQETRYATGRVRKKDPQGNLIYDCMEGC